MEALKKLISYFFQGVLFVTPTVLTLFILYQIFDFFQDLIPFEDKWLGTLIIVVSVTFVGYMGSNFIIRALMDYFEDLMKRVPGIKLVYSTIKDFLSAFVGRDKKFTEPVLVKVGSNGDLEKLGFITKKDLSDLGISSDKVAVYLPHSYNFSGNMFIVPSKNITPINANPSDVMKLIVTGGVSSTH